jgi:hypothetical protein
LAHFYEYLTKSKIPFEIEPPLIKNIFKNVFFLGRWGFAYTYDAKERILFMHGGFSATHNHGQTILFQINSISKCPVPVLGLIHLLADYPLHCPNLL